MGTPLARAEMLSIMMQGQLWEYTVCLKPHYWKFQNVSIGGKKKKQELFLPQKGVILKKQLLIGDK